MAIAPTTPTPSSPGAAGTAANPSNVGRQTGTESSLSSWAGPYVTGMLGKAEALTSAPFQAYGGPLSAGQSALQQQAFQGLAGLAVPQNMGAFTPGTFGTQQAQQYMNPFLQAALEPQIAEARRQADISRMQDAARLTKAGGFGGSRQAIMESEGRRNLEQQLASITGTGYASAFDKAREQFNVEQDRARAAQEYANRYGMEALAAQMTGGDVQRGIAAEDIAARKSAFEAERDNPFKMLQFQQSMLQGLPLATSAFTYQQPSGLASLSQAIGGTKNIYDQIADIFK